MPEEGNISTNTATNNKAVTANLDCVPADKASTWTVVKRKATEGQGHQIEKESHIPIRFISHR
ncbi:hypothetical protein K0M31_012871 [Melipona bicolor]|uniref:Uncharacterized protein n=1 Tax=Melipona bicolor TaxID=60889 RepID=A0AA40KH51_9HYME|nr:hypothetical protein K0M31_012871 [Melipona bicolor]